MKRLLAVSTASLLLAVGAARAQSGVGWTFTYQGQLNVSGQLANGSYDLQFKLFDSLSGGTQVGPTVAASSVAVSRGLITQPLDFGSGALNGQARWLEIGVKPAGQAVAYTVLTPRQPLSPAPYARGLSLPYSGTFGTIFPLVSLTQTSTGDGLASYTTSGIALTGQTSGGGTAVFGYNLGPSGSAGVFRSESGNNIAPTLVVQGAGSGPGLAAYSLANIAGKFDITETSNLYAAVKATTAGLGAAGEFQNTNPNSSAATLSSVTAGAGTAVAGHSIGTGQAATFQITNPASLANAVDVANDGAGNGLYVRKTGNTGAATLAVQAAAPTANALNIVSGTVRCQGAGLNTNTFVFRHRMAAAEAGTNSTRINNPQCDGHPEAMLLITQTWESGTANLAPNVTTYYDYASGHWRIFGQANATLPDVLEWTVMVVRP